MIRNAYDRISLFTVALIALLRLLAWVILPPLAVVSIIPLVFLTFVLYNIKHNHLHFRIFSNRKLNLLLENIMNVFTGTTFSSMKIIHQINHHAEENSADDWGWTLPYEKKNAIHSICSYTVATVIRFVNNKRKWLNSRKGHTMKRRNHAELVFMLGVYSAMFIVIPWNTVMYIIIPNIVCQIVLVAFNYLQHGDCDADSTYNHSRNFTGKVLNFFVFNAGFHTAHHLRPALHWSEYPSFHASLQDRIDPKLNVDNLFTFLIRQLINQK